MENIWSTHPVLTIIGAMVSVEFTVYVAVSIGIIAPHLGRGFSWPVRAIRNARRFL